jgi:hypothetical protein
MSSETPHQEETWSLHLHQLSHYPIAYPRWCWNQSHTYIMWVPITVPSRVVSGLFRAAWRATLNFVILRPLNEVVRHRIFHWGLTPSPYKQCATPPRICQVSRVTPWQETYLARTYFRKTEITWNHPYQNVLVTWTQVKTLYKQQTQTNLDLLNKTLGYGDHLQHRNSATFPVEDLAYDSGRTLVRAKYGYPRGSPNTNS